LSTRAGDLVPERMTIGTSLFLIAVGAILKFATHFHIAGIDLHTVGVILMLVGAFGLVLGLFMLTRARSTDGPVVPPL
jgi:hypothetical protein